MRIVVTQTIEQKQGFETASWYELWSIQTGAYELVKAKDGNYFAKCNAVLVEDYFPSSFGGLQYGSYDSKQNAGKQGFRNLSFSPIELLTDSRIELSESQYDAVLFEASELLKSRIEICMSCLKSNHKDGSIQWMQGHAERLAKLTALFSEIHGVMARREYNAKQQDGKGWSQSETQVRRS